VELALARVVVEEAAAEAGVRAKGSAARPALGRGGLARVAQGAHQLADRRPLQLVAFGGIPLVGGLGIVVAVPAPEFPTAAGGHQAAPAAVVPAPVLARARGPLGGQGGGGERGGVLLLRHRRGAGAGAGGGAGQGGGGGGGGVGLEKRRQGERA